MPDTLQKPDSDSDHAGMSTDDRFQDIINNSLTPAEKTQIERDAQKGAKEDAAEADQSSKLKRAYDSVKKHTGYGREALAELIEQTNMGEHALSELLEETGMSPAQAEATAKIISHAHKGMFNNEEEDSNARKKVRKAFKTAKRVRFFYNYKMIFILAVVAGILFLLILVGALKLPDVMEGIESYEFASVAKQFFDDSARVTDEDLAVSATSDNNGVFDQLKEKYGNLRDNMFEKVLGDAPDRVINNMGDGSGLELRFRTSKLTGRRIFTGGSINGVAYEVDAPSGIGRWTPGVKTFLKFRSQQKFYSSGFLDAVMEQMKSDDIAPIVRGIVFLKLLYSIGGSLSGWLLNRFLGDSPSKDDIQAIREQYQAGQAGANAQDNASTAEIKQATQAAQDQEEADANSDQGDLNALNNNGFEQNVLNAANSALGGGLLTTILHFTGFVWGIVAPFCIIFDGSVVQSGPSISNQMNQVQDAFDQLAAEADQQKLGDQNSTDGGALANAIQGTNDEVGDISTSLPYQRAYGRVQSTDFIPSVEAGADGSYQYSLLDVLGVPANSLEGRIANGIVSSFCHVMTNIWTSVGLTVAQIIAFFLSLGTEPAVADAAGETASNWIVRYVTAAWIKIVGKQVIKQGVKKITLGLMARVVRFAIIQGVVLTGTLALTWLAHMEVASRAGVANDGLAVGRNLVDMADNGANIQASELQREMLFGRPLLSNEVAQLESNSIQDVDYANSQKSFTDRYFALSNYDSLVTHLGMDLGASEHFSIISSIVKLGSAILNPTHSIATLFGSIFNQPAFAAADSITYDYGNVQFGWSDAENQLVNGNDTYAPLENQRILDDASQVNGMSREDAIAQKYSICFGYDYNGSSQDDSLDPSDQNGRLSLGSDGTVSSLLVNADIVRDGNTGDVINGGGLCDPDMLSYDSSDPLAADAQMPELNGKKSPLPNDMIFRWRLAEAYENTADQLISEGVITRD